MGIIVSLSCFFSILFSLLVLSSASTLNMWLYIELSVLSVIPCFFGNYSFSNYYKGLLYYLLLSGISSGFIFSGLILINQGADLVIFVGFLVKFCLFPLGFWLYLVGTSSSWIVIWLITCCSKIYSPIVGYLFSNNYLINSCFVLSSLTFLFCGVYFWFGCSNNVLIWINMSIASSCLIFLVFISYTGYLLYSFLFFYLFWSSLCILFLSNLSNFYSLFSSGSSAYLLYSIPFSLSFVYKFLSVVVLIVCLAPWPLVISFFFYGVSEQYYLFKSWGFLWSIQDGNLF
uniref:NADH dehydrogenase subunit 2 n=1 Tax=Capsaloides cristatus TaxID=1101449 RepID=A0A6M3RFL9_9PLAT|nr:NADH dehydrogenase subunit 2 [Capsaloides cristatus]